MRNLSAIIAAAISLTAVPAFADVPARAAQPAITLALLDFCVGPDCRYRDDRYRDGRYRERFGRDYGYDRDYRRGDRGCRDVTIRDRRGDEVVVRHERRCD